MGKLGSERGPDVLHCGETTLQQPQPTLYVSLGIVSNHRDVVKSVYARLLPCFGDFHP